MNSTLVLDREGSTTLAVLLKGKRPETTMVSTLDQLKEIYEKNRPSKTTLLLMPDETIIALKSLPVEKESEIVSALGFAMEEDLPYPAERYDFAFKTLKRQNGTTLVLIGATPKDRMEKLLKPLHEIGISPSTARVLTVEALQWASEHIKEDEFIVVFFIKGTYLLASFSQNVPVYLKISTNRSFILMELERIKRETPLPVYWAGPSPVEGSKEISFDISDLYKNLSKKGRLSLSYTLKDTGLVRLKMAFYMVITLAVVVHLLSSFVPYVKAHKEASLIRQKLMTYKKESSSVVREMTEIENKIRFLKKLDRLIAEKEKALLSIQAISEAIPKDAELENLKVQSSRIQLIGYAPDTIKVLNSLKKTGKFININSTTTASNKEGLERFIIKMEFRTDE